MNKKTQLSKYILFISGFTLFVVIVLVVQAGYNNLVKNTSSLPAKLDTDPLDIKLNLKVIDEIKSSQEYTLSDLQIIPTEIVDQQASQSANTNE